MVDFPFQGEPPEMATAYPSVAANYDVMSAPVETLSRRSIRKLAPDQKYAKARKVTKAEAKKIAKEGSAKILAETGSAELAKDFEKTMIRILPGSVPW